MSRILLARKYTSSKEEFFQQSLLEHLNSVANSTSSTLGKINFKNLGTLLGLTHDIGKCRKKWQEYINNDSSSIPHSIYGSLLVEAYSDNNNWDKVLRHMVGVVVNSHHGFLKDMSEYRLLIEETKTSSKDSEVLDFIESHVGADFFKSFFEKSINELQTFDDKVNLFLNQLFPLSDKDSKIIKFRTKALLLGLLTRFAFSALIDADRLNAANFRRACENKPIVTDCNGSKMLWSNMICDLEKHISHMEHTSVIGSLRSEISNLCAIKGRENNSLLRLCVPTGGGKTLSSMRFALEHSFLFDKEKIFYVAPYTTILDQTHEVLSDVFGDENLLVHYSSFESPDIEDDRICEELIERWNSPVVITTLVQFLNALFGGDSNCARRMNKLVNSVIIFDEIQTLPPHCRYLFNIAVNFLTEICNCTIVFCSATQPLHENLKYPTLKPVDIIKDAEGYFKKFSRVKIIDARKESGCTVDSLTTFIKEKHEISTLVVTNTKEEAKLLYQNLKSSYKNKGSDVFVFHLSTNMCPAHRRRVFGVLKSKLKEGASLICVSTSLIEAGVDISFYKTMRFPNGLDSIWQTSGRCNRNMEKEIGITYIVNGIQPTKKATINDYAKVSALNSVVLDPSCRYPDLLSPDAMNAYYRKYYSEIAPVFGGRDINTNSSKCDIVNLLSDNTINWKSSVNEVPELYNEGSLYLHQDFRTAGNLFKVIDDNTVSVIVPYNDDAISIIEEIQLHGPSSNLLKRAQNYIVAAFINKIKESNFFIPIGKSGIYTVPKEAYDAIAVGLNYDYDIVGDLCL